MCSAEVESRNRSPGEKIAVALAVIVKVVNNQVSNLFKHVNTLELTETRSNVHVWKKNYKNLSEKL